MNKIKILLADDHDGFRRVLASFLRSQQGLELVGEAVDGDDAIDKSNQLKPDLVLIDVHMPLRNGVEATRAIKILNPNTKVIMMSVDPSENYQRYALLVADAYVPKTSIKEDLLFIIGSFSGQQYSKAAVV
jgi:DNA-binding NarL/FixJ family response regulator